LSTIIFGVDGLTFRILHPMMERGELPNFRRLQQEGCEAVLESKYPPLTPPAWVSLSTGLRPASHGVYDFWEYEDGEQAEQGTSRKARVQTHRKGGKAIWNILSEYGKRVLVLNVPMTYPPEPVNGIMISGYMTPSREVNFTYPNDFKEELLRAVPAYEIDLDFRQIYVGKTDERQERLINATLRMTEERIKLLDYLLAKQSWDLCYVAFVGPDRLQHPLWKNIVAMEQRATEYYRLLDSALGKMLDQLGPDDDLFVVSDHGFQGVTTVFDINEYLHSKGLLVLTADHERAVRRAGRTASLKYQLKRMGLLTLVRRVKKSLKSAGILETPVLDLDRPLLNDIDWDHTLACVPSSSGYGGGFADVFLSDKLDADRFAELCEDLKRQVHPRTGQPLVEALYTTEVYGTGPYAPREPHLIILPTDGITFRMNLGNKRFWDDASKMRGTHQKDGVLYAYGKHFKAGFHAPPAEIYDLVPTVLQSMGLPLPHKFDGRILDELFITSQQHDAAQAQEANAATSLARRKLQKLLEV
jgi:predicted AlkP superfamily phosphohydrolase/phosphomutase